MECRPAPSCAALSAIFGVMILTGVAASGAAILYGAVNFVPEAGIDVVYAAAARIPHGNLVKLEIVLLAGTPDDLVLSGDIPHTTIRPDGQPQNHTKIERVNQGYLITHERIVATDKPFLSVEAASRSAGVTHLVEVL